MKTRREAKLTSKGQLTLPQAIRQALGVGPGDEVAFEVTNQGVKVVPVRPTSPFHGFIGRWRDGEGMTAPAINAWLREIRGHEEETE